MSLRSRKQSLINRRGGALSLPQTKDDLNGKDGPHTKEPVTQKVLLLTFLLICALGGYREYLHVKIPPSSKKTSLTVPVSHRELNPNFHSLLTPEQDQALEVNEDDHTRYHLIFSTDCSPYQHWQSYLVYYSAMRVKQPGTVTRIASGCEDEDAKKMQEWFHEHIQGMSTRFHLHMTPYFSGVKNEKGDVVGDYKFFNKPFGLKHWLEHAEHMSLQQTDDIVILIDPDMVLLRPITGDFSSDRDTVIGPKRLNHILGRKVEHGLPFAQTYGLGFQWEGFDLDRISGTDSPAKQVNKEDGKLYFPVGPPYLGTVRDMYQIALKWTEFVPHVHEQYPHLLAEMYAFCIAAAHLGLRHQLIDSLMVSNTEVTGGEGWPLIDKIPNDEMCSFAREIDTSRYAVPSVVHLCQRYAVGDKWFFGKRKFPTDFFDCSRPLLQEPPDNLGTLADFKQPPNAPQPKPLTSKQTNREAFMVCFLTRVVNDAATFYKQQSCPDGTANLSKSIKMVELFREYRKQHPEEDDKE